MKSRLLVVALAAVVVAGAILAILLWRRSTLPQPGTAAYEAVTAAFYSGLAELEVGLLENAAASFTRATELVEHEPASWANLGLARARLGEIEAALEPVSRARELAPDNPDLVLLGARLRIVEGDLDAALEELRRAVAIDPNHLKAKYALVEELARAGSDEASAEALRLLDELHALEPSNIAILLERARLAATREDASRLAESVSRLEPMARTWPEAALEQYAALRQAAESGSFPDAARGTALLRNVLARVAAFSADLAAVRTSPEIIAEPIVEFIALASPPSTPAPADATLAFIPEELTGDEASTVVPFWPDGIEGPVLLSASNTGIRLADGSTLPVPGSPDAAASVPFVLPLDWDNDFRTDLLVAASAGVRLFLQNEAGAFDDRTAAAGTALPPGSTYLGAWAADIDMDGDLDVVLGTAGAGTIVLRNNADVTWTVLPTFQQVPDARAFAWADLDRDGDPDAVFLSGEGIRMFLNERGGAFREIPAPPRSARGMTVADIDADGVFDIVTLGADGTLWRSSLDRDGRLNDVQAAAPAGGLPEADQPVSLFAADFDNNGALDVLASSGALWLANERHELQPQDVDLNARVTGVADVDGDGRADLVGVSPTADTRGRPVRLRNQGTAPYHWKQVRVRAQAQAGDQRINSFAVGGEIEARSGLLRQKQLLSGAPLLFGLGDRTTIDVVRMVWPNGVPQAEFNLAVDDVIVAEQRLKGSCPWVFTHNGQDVVFVTDFLWRSPLGLRINAQDTAAPQTEDWVLIRGDQLAPHEGMYDVRITAELWETHFFDHVSLLVVDHPADTEVFVDERFARTPPAFSVQALRDVRPVAAARDGRGRDVTHLVARRDGRYLVPFERGRYQGIARDHVVEIETGAGGRASSPEGLVLVAHGWVYPTDSSINVAISQGKHPAPRGLALEYQTEDGRWAVAEPDLGFPAGKNKTMLIDLRKTRGARRIRLRTNLEVTWDLLAIGVPADITPRVERLSAARAELRYRGYSSTTSPRGEAPETPIYAPVAATGQRWLDLEGYYTRFGDVRELIEAVDDRYVIMNAGDEMRLQFEATPEPPEGWRRDFVLVGDGWEKDGDFNTEFSTTVLPLPAHGPTPYDASTPPGALEDDPVYRRHAADWQRYHTRYVSRDAFVRGLGHVSRRLR